LYADLCQTSRSHRSQVDAGHLFVCPRVAIASVLEAASRFYRAWLPDFCRLHDPGNWATDLAGGSRYGYTLLFVIMASNLMAILLQSLSLKLGVCNSVSPSFRW
jgi:hypothetical protein